MKAPIAQLEIEEYLFSQTAAKFAQANSAENAASHIRESFRLHRFVVFTWLLENGAMIPGELLADFTHPPVGEQAPDKPAHET